MKVYLLLALPLLLNSVTATGQSERTYVKTFALMNRQTIILNIGDNVQIVRTDNADVIRLQMTIQLANAGDAILKSLAQDGRYIVGSDMTLQALRLNMPPQLKVPLRINNIALQETVRFTIFVPKNINIEQYTGDGVLIANKQP